MIVNYHVLCYAFKNVTMFSAGFCVIRGKTKVIPQILEFAQRVVVLVYKSIPHPPRLKRSTHTPSLAIKHKGSLLQNLSLLKIGYIFEGIDAFSALLAWQHIHFTLLVIMCWKCTFYLIMNSCLWRIEPARRKGCHAGVYVRVESAGR